MQPFHKKEHKLRKKPVKEHIHNLISDNLRSL